MDSVTFFQEWTKFSYAKVTDLQNLLFSQWDNFKSKIFGYYMENITNEYCKKLLTQIGETSQIGLSLHNFSQCCPSNDVSFLGSYGEENRKATITDCQESKVLKLINLNNYQTKINTMINKYYNAGMKLLEGLEDSD
nr:uncharacterized protein LOC118879477 [Drosophila suzukii]